MNILRRNPPSDVEENLAGLCHLLGDHRPELTEELLQRVDTPLSVAVDPTADGRPFLKCDHNRDGSSYRSPWSNAYFPSSGVDANDDDRLRPSPRLRDLEVQANEVFDIYRRLYYGDASVSSVYLWDADDDQDGGGGEDFAGIFLIRKGLPNGGGYWNSVHVAEVSAARRSYKLTTTVLFSLEERHGGGDGDGDSTVIDGSLTRRSEKTFASGDEDHLVRIGRMIEDTEYDLRSNLDYLYIQKTKEIMDNLRVSSSDDGHSASSRRGREEKQKQTHTMMLNAAIKKRQQESAE